MNICEKCEKKAVARKLCSGHYQQAVKSGEVVTGRKSLSERVLEKVNKSGPVPECAPELGSCWTWTASFDGKGYGQIQVGTLASPKMARAHRIVYELIVGPIPDGLVLDHLCRVPKCVNPEHLQPITQHENLQRGYWRNKTQCAKGHSFDERNTYYVAGKRKCRECSRAWARSSYKKRKSLGVPSSRS